MVSAPWWFHRPAHQSVDHHEVHGRINHIPLAMETLSAHVLYVKTQQLNKLRICDIEPIAHQVLVKSQALIRDFYP